MKKFLLIVCASLLSLHVAFAQERTITGKVVSSDDGGSLPGVNVLIKGTTSGTVTDSNGEYRLSAPASAEQIVFSFIGFQTQEITIGTRSVIDVTMGADVQQLNEVVVVGYGTQIKQDLTGNIASLKGDEVKNIPVPNFTQALQGRAAGVFVESESGRVGEGIKVRIRGSGSLTASNEPLYVVDGIPINTASLTSAQNGTSANNGSALSSINFNDIESFEILKDASAAAIYGSRAANGVVLITTKRGKAGKTNINANVQYGFNSPTKAERGFLNSEEYIAYFREAAANGAKYDYNRNGNPDGYATEQEAIDDYVGFVESRFTRYSGHSDWRTLQTNTNWEKEAYKKNPMVKIVNLSASGGTDKTKFFVSGEYTNQDGILVGNKFDRISTRLNVDQEVSKIFKMGMNMSMARTVTGRVTQDNDFGTPMQIVALAPITPVRDLNGQLYDRPVTTYYNPLINLENGHYKSTIFRNLGGLYGQLNLFEGLAFRSEIGYDVLTQNDDQFFGSRTQSRATNGAGQSDWLRTFNYNTNNFLTYNTLIGKHTIDATLGMSFQKASNEQTNVTGQDFPSDDLKKLVSAGQITGGFSFAQQYSFLSYFSRVNFKFSDKYLLSLSGRVDGSSRFGADNRYGFFPAVSAGWIISQEQFLSENGTLSFLKLRASAGRVGNAEIPEFQALGLWGSGKYYGSSTLNPTQLANPQLGWEQATQIDIGLDYGLFNNRVSGELDYYKKNTTDLLYNTPVPATSGFTNRVSNVGSMQNEGFEIVINSVNVNSRNFKWNTAFNFSRNINKVTKLDGEVTEIPGNDGRYLNSLVVGQPMGVFFGPKYAGVDPTNGDALYYTADGESTTTNYNNAGNFVVGNPNPKFIYGLNNTFTLGGFDLSVLLQGVYGNSIMNGAGGFMSANADWFDNQTRDQLDRWQKAGDITMVPQARLNLSGLIPNGVSASSRYIYDGSYLRVKTVALGYNFPAQVLSKFKLSSLRVYASGQNLFTFTKYPGWDPEVNADYRSGASNNNQGGDFYSAPQIKSVIFGLNVGF
jgi:TonB-dependent starch-binding outer membrane protein SusC